MKKEKMERPAGFGEKITQSQADQYNKHTKWPVGGYELLDKKPTSIPMTRFQHQMCKDYKNGKLTKEQMYTLFKTYLNEYIALFGWKSWQKDPIRTILDNFCSASTL